MKYIVYKTTNIVNNKIYIGVRKLHNESDTYIGCGCYKTRPCTFSYPKTPFQAAVKKYGPDKFIRETLYEFENSEDAFSKEQEIVNQEFISNPNTYNIALGGNGGSIVDPKDKSYPVFQYSLKGELIKEWDTTVEAAEYFDVNTSKISCAVNDCYELFGYFWSRSQNIVISKYKVSHHKYTYLYNSSGKFIQQFSSRTLCASFLGCCPQSISKALYSKKSIKGYYVSETLEDEYIPDQKIDICNKSFYVYEDNTLLGYLPPKDIVNLLKLNNLSQLTNIIVYNKGRYKNFFISEIDKFISEPKKSKEINIYDLNGNFIEKCNSIKEVLIKYNLNSAEMNRILKGIKNHKYYIFKYANDIV